MSETVLKVENLNLTYSKGGPQVLFDISFAVDNNDFYAIIGPVEQENHLLLDA